LADSAANAKGEYIMEEKKNILTNNEVKDEELDTVSGGAPRPRQQQTKKCAMDG